MMGMYGKRSKRNTLQVVAGEMRTPSPCLAHHGSHLGSLTSRYKANANWVYVVVYPPFCIKYYTGLIGPLRRSGYPI